MSLVLEDVRSGYNLSNINTNFQRLEDAFNNDTLRRSNLDINEDNAMQNALDMNGNEIINATVEGTNLTDLVNAANDSIVESAANAAAAAASAEEAALSEAGAGTSATNAGIYAGDALAQANRAESEADRAEVEADRAFLISEGLNGAIRNGQLFDPDLGAYPTPTDISIPWVWFASRNGTVGSTVWAEGEQLHYVPDATDPENVLGSYYRVGGELAVGGAPQPIDFLDFINLPKDKGIRFRTGTETATELYQALRSNDSRLVLGDTETPLLDDTNFKVYINNTNAENVSIVESWTDPTTKLTPSVEYTVLSEKNGYTQTQIDALDAANVKLTGDQTIAGTKTFDATLELPAGDAGAGAIRQIRYNSTIDQYEGYTTARGWAQMGGNSPLYEEKTADFTISAGGSYKLLMSDGVSKTVTIPDGLNDGDAFTVNLSDWDRELAGLICTFQLGTEVLTNGTDTYDSLIVNTPSVVSMSRIGGEWYMVATPNMGDYGQLEQRVDVSQQVLHVVDEKVSGTNGGDAVVGEQVRDLNTVVLNTIEGSSLTGNIITLPAGTYKVHAKVPAYAVDRHVAFLEDNNTNAVLSLGTSEFAQASSAAAVTSSVIQDILLLPSVTDIKVVHDVQAARAGNGLGVGTHSVSHASRFTDVFIERVS